MMAADNQITKQQLADALAKIEELEAQIGKPPQPPQPECMVVLDEQHRVLV